MNSGFYGIFVIASNPVNITTHATLKFSGFPVWSNANVGGLNIEEWRKTHPEVTEEALDKVYFGVPIVIGKTGAKHIIEVPLSDEEKEKLDHSVKTLKEIIRKGQL